MSFGFGFALPAYPLRGGGGNNPFNQLGPTLDLSFAGVVTDQSDPNGYTLNTNFIIPQYQIAAQYVVWETGVGLVDKTFSQIITFTRASTATYFDSAGVLQSAAIDAPRFDYNPSTLAAQGLLIEESRTNSFLQSGDISNASWVKVRSSTPGTTTTSPSGGLAQKLVEDTSAANNHFVRQDISVTSGTTYTQSVFVKAAERNQIQLTFDIDNGAFTLAGVIFTLTGSGSGTIIAGAPSFSITLINNGWYRCTVTQVAAASATAVFRIALADGGTAFYTGDGTSGLFIWGAQLEAGAFPTSYIPTTTTALTRAADVASVNTLSPWYNSASGTLYVEATTPPGLAGFPNSIGISDGTINNRTLIYVFTNGFYSGITTGGVSQGNAAVFVTPTIGAASKFAAAYNTNLLQSALNGTAGTPDTTINLPSGLNIMRIGAATLSSNFYNSHIQRITYYPRAFSQTELQTLTT